MRVVGRLKQDRWKDKDGKNQNRIYVVAEHVECKPKFNNSVIATADATDTDSESPQASEERESVF